MNISAIPSAQKWLSQFLPQDKPIAEKLLNQLVYISTDDVVSALGEHISALIVECDKVAIFPVRELIRQNESYFKLGDDDAIPVVQPNDITLGSEAFVSNLVTQLGRRNREKVISPEGNTLNPTINNLRTEKVDSLILVDDLIGSGNRTKEFLESVYQHPTIRSWLSGKHLEIHIVSYMASEKGKRIVEKWCAKHKKTTLHVLNKCPMLNVNDEALIDLCKRYVDKKEKLPIGYGSNPVRVVFSHSAPNNLPALLFRDRTNLKSKDASLRPHITSWKALFPRRALTEALKTELSEAKPNTSLQQQLIELLIIVSLNPGININLLNHHFSGNDGQKNICKVRCIKFGWLREINSQLFLTENGERELIFINKNKNLKVIANNDNNYYPSCMSRALSHQD
ncbi:MAG: hypothetical protein ACJA0H_000021 [Francisellaceae bacterium]